MIIAAVLCLVLGVFCGQFLFMPKTVEFFAQLSDYALIILLISVGLSIGQNAYTPIRSVSRRIP